MTTRNADAPWGITRMAPYAETRTVPRLTAVIDPETQIAVVIDEHGRALELYHQTGSGTSSSTSTSCADSYDSDSSSDSDHD
ncbi:MULTISPECIES: putative ATP-grasp-modified RiPP [unclassified Streptomyces]|uniref:putative ATP-grasp-modified RiPP n=1 Tax=unclassified Streptomyces TaxID=2593676 RepID=UPI0004C258C9|nr:MULTISPECIES: putative ATP-grasp-modified RiPP [unclassified Streptomyces]